MDYEITDATAMKRNSFLPMGKIMDKMKERPKVGDRVEFRCYGMARIGRAIAVVAETGVHFLVEAPGLMYKYKRIGLDAIIRILPEDEKGALNR